MADAAPAPVWVTGLSGGIEFVNRAFEIYCGAPRDRLLGDAWVGLLHPEDLPAVGRQRESARATNSPYAFEARFRAADGGWRWMQASSNPRFDEAGVFQGYVGLAVDLTEMRLAEAALRESEERFRLISESAPVMLWMGDAQGKCLYLNKAQREFWGVQLEDVPTFSWNSTVHPDSFAVLQPPFTKAMTEHVGFVVEAVYRRADGEWRTLRTQAQPRFGPGGEFLGMIGVNADVTEARQAESDLKRINELLAERIAGALAEKEQVERALFHAQKMEAVGRLTGGVAHDFNNLLTVVIGSLDMARGKLDDPAKLERLLSAAMEAARRGERLTNQLLSFSRRQALRPSLCDLNQMVGESGALLSRVVGEQIELDVRLCAAPCRSFVDASQLEAALLNLVVNARDAMPNGGAILIEADVRTMGAADGVEVAAGEYAVLRVADTGMGMSKEVLERVLEPFFTTKEVGKGTGLGLSQVYGFVRQSGGGMRIDSQEGAGACVELYLPLAEGEAPAAAPEKIQPTAIAEPLRILLVEDDTAVGHVAEEMISALGHTVVRARDASEALQRLEADEAFDAMVTDLIMPGGMNGAQLAEVAAARDPDLKILLVSGYVDGDAEDALARSDRPFLRKPYSREDLSRVLAAFGARRTLAHA